jgi:hypothetical protein
MHPPSLQPALQVDEGAKGKDSDHQALASSQFVVKPEKRKVKTRPMPQSKVDLFCAELTQHRWEEVFETEEVNMKVDLYHQYQRDLLDKYLPEKTVTISNLDKAWMTPELKQLLRQVQRERLNKGKNGKFKQLWAKFRRLKRKQIKTFHKKFVQDLKVTSPGKWYMMMKKLGGLDQMNAGKIDVKSLRGLSDKEAAAAVAQSFAAVSQEYSPLDREQLPAFLPAGRPEQVSVFQVLERIKKLGKTKSTLPIDLPDRLRIECAIDLAEPLTDIINSCLRTGQFPVAWRREWVTPVPKPKRMEDVETCKDLRKIASTSDSAKIFESFLRDWITEDIGANIDINQFAGKTGVGTEHMIVWMMDRVLKLLDQPGMSAVVAASVDWSDAFSRTDPTKTVQKLIRMGLRPSIIPIIIEFLEDRVMSLKFNGEESPLFHLIGGGPQGSWNGQNCYLTASNDNTDFVNQEDRFKYCDDVNILELIMIGAILTQYNFYEHVASDIGIEQSYLPLEESITQQNLTQISEWTSNNLMQLNKKKTNYQVFTRSRQDFATRLHLDGQVLERKRFTKILGVWLQEDGGWQKNTEETCKAAYQRVSMLTKLRYAGETVENLLHIYKQFIRSKLEYCSVAVHSALTLKQSRSIERCQAVCLRIILQDSYESYESALTATGLKKLSTRRFDRCLDFSLKCLKHAQNKRMFPLNPNLGNVIDIRQRERFVVNFARTQAYQKSAIPFCQNLLNTHFAQLQEEGGDGPREGDLEGEVGRRRRRG